MKILCLFMLLFSGFSFFPKLAQDISYWKPQLSDIDDITCIKLTANPVGPIWKNKAIFKSDKKEDTLPFYRYIFGNHFKKAQKKSLQTWKYTIYFHKGEGGFKEHKIQVSNKGISYEGVFYPFQSEKDKKGLFSLLEAKLT